MKTLQTEDGSFTLYNKEYDQHYHSKSGAIEEATKKYVDVCELQNGMTVIDYCFGLGFNSLVALARFDNLYVYALENDAMMLLSLDVDLVPDSYKPLYSQLLTALHGHLNKNETDFEVVIGTSTIRFLVGDARETITHVKDGDVCFFDPFSPVACPHLWTVPVFKQVYAALKQKGMVATYSYARIVREGFAKAGFTVKDGPIVGRRSPSTLAYKGL